MLTGQARGLAEEGSTKKSIEVSRNRVVHANHVITFFSNHRWLLRKPKTKRIAARVLDRQIRIKAWNLKRIRNLNRPVIPYGESALRAYINDDCLEEIIDRETADTWNHRVYNYQGSGAYGLPQALPGSKMSAFGDDWATNPVTQIKWMRHYVNTRYGGSCGALAFHNANGWY